MKKISVMIVDDEKLALEDLSTIVDWDALGFEIIATAVNGRQALAKFQQFRPQVVITDIKMPFMDGIELIGHLRELDTQVKILLLTAYEDFSYAKSAIQYGITDYIIKSEINARSFAEQLCKLRKAISSEDKEQDILRDKMISDFFLTGAMPDNDLFRMPYCYLLIEQDLPINLASDMQSASVLCASSALLSVLTADEYPGCILEAASAIPQDQILLALDVREVSQSAIQQVMRQCALEKRALLEDQFQSAFTVYTVSQRMNLVDLKRLYLQNCPLFQTKYLSSCGQITDLASYRPIPRTNTVDLDLSELKSMVDRLDGPSTQRYLDELHNAVQAAGTLQSLSTVCQELYALLKHDFVALPDYVEKPDLSFQVNWRYWLDLTRLHKWFSACFETLISEKAEVYRHGYSKPIIRAIDYIYHNYPNNELTINQIAAEVHLSTGHLCALFKKETSKTLKNYITEVRISEAKRLLEEGSLKIYEISSAVGYQSSQYFSQVFYKQTGIYPTEYQRGRKPEDLL